MADLKGKIATENVFKKHLKIEDVIHLSASKAVKKSVQKPLLHYRNNIVSLINLLELIAKYNDVKVSISSSS